LLSVPAEMNAHHGPIPSATTPPAGVRTFAHKASARVLVVDGDEPVAAAIGGTLLLDGHDVTVVFHAMDAVSLLASGERFDVILCAVDLPGVSGLELYAMLSKVAGEAGERIVFMRSEPLREAERAFLERVARPCYVKPAELTALRELVRSRAVAVGPS
jgi:CheY-like chemotaxis protein